MFELSESLKRKNAVSPVTRPHSSSIDSTDSDDIGPPPRSPSTKSTKNGTNAFANLRRSFSMKGSNLQLAAAISEATAASDEFVPIWERARFSLDKAIKESVWGQRYEDVLIGLSVLSCFEFIYQSYLSDPRTETTRIQAQATAVLDLFFAGIFGFDWAMKLFLADHRFNFFMR